MPSVAVILPCHNDAALLRRALHHLHGADELIVVDNASTDASAEVARAYGARVIYEPQVGIPYAVRAGFDAARSDILVRIDADVLPGEHFIQRIREAWDQADEHTVAMTGWAWFEHRPRWQSIAYLGAYYLSVGSALGHWPLFGSNCSLRRSWWLEAGVQFPDAEVHEDMHMSFALGQRQRVGLLPNPVFMHPRALEGDLGTRFRRGWHTIAVNWRTQPPGRRLPERLLQ